MTDNDTQIARLREERAQLVQDLRAAIGAYNDADEGMRFFVNKAQELERRMHTMRQRQGAVYAALVLLSIVLACL